MGKTGIRKAVFLDRDGTLNVERNYLYKREEWEWIAGVPQALRRLSDAGYALIVISNQSGIARGYYTKADVDELHSWVDEELFRTEGIRFDGFYICPHHPSFGSPCNCRKPSPSLLFKAASEHDIELDGSWMVGDMMRDIEAGRAAGCRTILVKTGYGIKEAPVGNDVDTAENFSEAADMILRICSDKKVL